MAGEKGNSLCQLYLEGLFQAAFSAISSIFQNAASPLTNLYVSLHTADPKPVATNPQAKLRTPDTRE